MSHWPGVPVVLGDAGNAEIGPSVVGPIAVDVVNSPVRPLSGHIEPSQPGSPEQLVEHPHFAVALSIEVSDFRASLGLAAASQVRETPCFGVVMNDC